MLLEARHKRQELYRNYHFVRGLGAAEPARGRALVAITTAPFVVSDQNNLLSGHAVHWRCKAIVAVLTEFGFSVDVTDRRNMRIPKTSKYDIVFGGGGMAFTQACKRRGRNCNRIYLAFGKSCKATAAAAEERSVALFNRRGIRIRQRFPSEEGLAYATEVWYTGNSFTGNSLRAEVDVPVHQLTNTVIDGVTTTLDGKDFNKAPSHFMWMASYATLLRGLDVLLEVFEQLPEYHLWVCGNILHEKSFAEHYHVQLHDLSNIHYVGWVDVTSAEYQELTRRCAFFVYPSASDGMPGSVVNAMAAGLVPVVTDDAGMECGAAGIRIPSIEINSLRNVICEAAKMSPIDLEAKAREAASFARECYSKERFVEIFRTRLKALLDANGGEIGMHVTNGVCTESRDVQPHHGMGAL